MAKSKDGIEEGEFETSGADRDLEQEESKQRSGTGSAKSNLIAHPRSEYAHKRPVTS